jgi:hypothetical protein
MSSIEVAYELKGKADYMLATQGTMFVNGWPYRQLLKKTFNQVKAKKKERNAKDFYNELISNLYYLCLYNFTDFMTAGYSCDIALCDLHPGKVEGLKKPLQDLMAILKQNLGLQPNIIKDLILLAHWDAQSFWSENYTDLWDFCDCLAERCKNANTGTEIMELCEKVKNALVSEDSIVLHADNFGTEYQYARGLSIYFPWHEPFEVQEPEPDSNKQTQSKPLQSKPPRKTILQNYEDYAFTQEFGLENSWFRFLTTYWKGTQRKRLKESEEPFINLVGPGERTEVDNVYNKAKELFDKNSKRTPELKKTPDVGTDCTCPTIKNYPTSEPPAGLSGNVPRFSITPGAAKAFLPTKEPDEQ